MQFRDSLLQGLIGYRNLRHTKRHLLITSAFVVVLGGFYFVGTGFLLRLWLPPPFFYRVGYHEIILVAYSGLVVYATTTLGIKAGLIVSLVGLFIAIPHHIFFPAQPDAYYRYASWLAKNCLLAIFIGAALNAKEQQGYYLREVFNIQEQERLRLSRELHDDIAQKLIDAGHAIDELLFRIKDPSPDFEVRLKILRKQTDQVLEDTRRAIQGLRPPLLEEIGLKRSLSWLCQELSEETNIEVEQHIDIEDVRMTPEIEFAIYRISQEAITNIKKHSAATKLNYSLWAKSGRIRLIISDNGRGFAPPGQEKLRAAGKMGLVGIRERVRLLKGTLDLESSPGSGTTLKIGIPLDNDGPIPM
jgi:signal transduction histidine kinase